jgi:hypothetical protein
MSRLRFLAAISPILLLVLACGGCAMPLATSDAATHHATASGTALSGDWGGQHIALSLSSSGGQIEYDCGQGSLDAPLVPDAAGAFRVFGRHVPGHGGPVRSDDPMSASQPAIYQGTVSGDHMQLRVTSGGMEIGAYSLRHGASAQLLRCL